MISFNPFSNIPGVPTSQQLIDMAFGRASKISIELPSKRDPLLMAKLREIRRIRTVASIISDRLKSIVNGMPNLDSIHPFYRDLFCVMFDRDSYVKSLRNVSWASSMILKLSKKYVREIKGVVNPREAAKLRRAFYGRVSSIIDDIDEDLKFLSDLVKLRRLPSIDFNIPIIVVCGAPNVGKSSFVKCVSTAEPEIAEYPFTTKNIILGHIMGSHGARAQIVDTPGLLDRPLNERNKIELQAIAALKNLRGGVVFLIDPTETCGYPLEYQLNVFKSVKEFFADRILVIGLTKMDLASKDQIDKATKLINYDKVYVCNSLNCIGTMEIVEYILRSMGA
jgi:nucleolar GTP-binding protein